MPTLTSENQIRRRCRAEVSAQHYPIHGDEAPASQTTIVEFEAGGGLFDVENVLYGLMYSGMFMLNGTPPEEVSYLYVKGSGSESFGVYQRMHEDLEGGDCWEFRMACFLACNAPSSACLVVEGVGAVKVEGVGAVKVDFQFLEGK